MMEFEKQSEKSLSRILSRGSSVGCSSRLSYYRSGEGVPFIWEIQPGVAKHKAPKEVIPPLTPPPALLSLSLPKPCIQLDPMPHSKLRFWMKSVQIGRRRRSNNSNKSQECVTNEDYYDDDDVGFDILARLDCSSDSESMGSPHDSSFSSLSFIKSRPSLQSTSSESTPTIEFYGRNFNLGCCFPMRISSVIVSIARRD